MGTEKRAARSYERLAITGCLVLWAVSLALPAVGVAGGPTLRGSDVLVQGYAAWRQGVLAWFANPALVCAAVAAWLRLDRVSVALSILGLGLALSSFLAGAVARGGGASVPEFSFLAGFYVWLGAHCGMFLAAFGGAVLHRNAAQS